MSNGAERCPECDTPTSGWLKGSCPICLMRLGTPTLQAETQGNHEHLQPSPSSDGEEGEIHKVGDYELLNEIARGGMGVVYRARQVSLKRLVAVKVLLTAEFANETARKRFGREAEAAASLSHPNIVSIYEVGEHNGQPYFSMELIDGHSLAELSRENPAPSRQAAQWLKTIAEAVHFAHERGVLHRDLKPSNVLVDNQDVPHVTDFGLAKLIEPGQDLTLTGQVLGTPSYMPPEQADPKRGQATPASDVYSLGAVLYQLLTTRPPFVAETLTQTLRLVAEGEAVRPRLLNPGAPRDLETICLKCLEKEPRRRYPSADELAKDLGRFLSNHPIAARPTTQLERAWRWCSRNRAIATAGSVALTLFLIVGIGSPIAAICINRERQQAEANRRKAEEEGARAKLAEKEARDRGNEMRRNLYAAEMNMANQVLDLVNGVRRIASVVSRWEYDRPDLRGWEWYYLNSLPHRESLTLRGHEQRVNALAANADGSRLASGSQDGTVRIWDVPSGRELAVLCRSSNAVMSVAWSPDGSKLISGSSSGLKIWDIATGKELRAIPAAANGSGAIRTVAWSPDGRRLAGGDSAHTIHIWDAATGEAVAELSGHNAQVNCVAWRVDNVRLASGAEDGTVRVWDTIAGKELMAPLQHAGPVRSVAWTSDGAQLASGADDNMAKIWDGDTGEALKSFRAHATVVTAVSWKPGTRKLATASKYDVLIREWDLSAPNVSLPSLRGHTAPGLSVAWSPNGAWLASGSEDGEIKIWNPASRDAQSKNDTIQGSFECVKWSPDGKLLAVAAANGFASIFDPSTEKVLHTFLVPTQVVSCVAWSGDGKRLAATFGRDLIDPLTTEHPVEYWAASGLPHPVRIWDVKSGEQVLALLGHTGRVNWVTWSPDSKRLITVGWDRTARIWDAEAGRELLVLHGRAGEILAADWSPDGRRVATGSQGQPGIVIWDASNGKELLALRRTGTRCFAWSPDGARAASAHDDGNVIIWDTTNGKELLTFRGHTSGALRVAWNSDGLRVLSVDREGLVKIWNPDDGQELLTFSKFARAAWAPDGVRLACVGKSLPASMIIYDATTGYAVSRSARALPGLNGWLESHPDDLGYLRRRAQVFAALGEWDKSADDYRQILSPATDHTARWFETGWWLCGPCPGRMDANLPPETQLDPVRSIRSQDSAEQVTWQPLSTEVDGPLNVRDFIEATEPGAEAFVYAQKRIWSAQNLDLQVSVTSEAPLRLWLNRRLIEWSAAPANTPVPLMAGWNTLLTKVSFQGTNAFSVKFSTTR